MFLHNKRPFGDDARSQFMINQPADEQQGKPYMAPDVCRQA